MKNLILKTVIIYILFTSCSTFIEPIEYSNLAELTPDKLNILNGDYKRKTVNQANITNADLFNSFFMFFKDKGKDNQNDVVKLEVLKQNKIKVSLIKNGVTFKSRKMKGKLLKNTFDFNRRNLIIPLFPLAIYYDKKARISIKKNGNLMVDTKETGYGTFIFFPFCGSNEYYGAEFEKVDN